MKLNAKCRQKDEATAELVAAARRFQRPHLQRVVGGAGEGRVAMSAISLSEWERERVKEFVLAEERYRAALRDYERALEHAEKIVTGCRPVLVTIDTAHSQQRFVLRRDDDSRIVVEELRS